MSTKAIQGELWSIAPENWSKHFEPYFLPVYRKVLNEINVSGETRLLDAGCGSGLFSGMAIRKGAEVIGIDAAGGLLEIARMRNPENSFMEEDLEAMPFTDNSFDIVTGFNSFQYAGNFVNALREAKRVLKKDGKLVVVIWDKPDLSDGTEVLKAISTLLPPPMPGTPGPFALSEDGKVETILTNIGMKNVMKQKVLCPFLYHHLANGVKSFMATGPAAAALNVASKAEVEKTITDAFMPFFIADDMYYLENSFLVFIADK